MANPLDSGQSNGPTTRPSATLDPLVHLSHTLTQHQKHLVHLYTSLGHQDPETCASDKISDLHLGILSTIENQAKEAEKDVDHLTKACNDISEQISNLRLRLGDLQADYLRSSNPDLEREALIPRLERLKKVEAELVEIKGEREVKVENVIKELESYIPILDDQHVKDTISRCGQSLRLGNVFGTNLSLEYIARLEKECHTCEAEVVRRTQILSDDLSEIFTLWGHLSVSPSQFTPLPDDSDHASFDKRVLSHLGIKDVSVTVNGDIEPVGRCEPVKMLPNDENLKKAKARRTWLDQERQRREDEIQRCYDELCVLWGRLGVLEEEQEEFVESWRGLSDQCVAGYQAELARMTTARKEHMVLFIQRERELIVGLWDQMYVSERERANVGMMTSDDYTEELLAEHEEKKKELMEELKDRKRLLTILDRYFTLLQEAHELQLAEKDPNRFAKGTRGDPGKLLREEKIRKRVAKEKPKLESEMKTIIPQWENERGRPFMVNGSRFLDDLVIRLEQETAMKGAASATRSRSAASAAPAKRQQTGSQSRTASPVKKRSKIDTSKSNPPRSVIRGSANPFGSATPRVVSRGATVNSAASQRIGSQVTGARAIGTRIARSTSNAAPPASLQPHRTGSSMSFYNPVTPTPYCRGPPQMMTGASSVEVPSANHMPPEPLPELQSVPPDLAPPQLVHDTRSASLCPGVPPRSVSGQSSCPGIPPDWPSIQPSLPIPNVKSETQVFTKFETVPGKLGNGRPPPPLKKGTFRPRPSVVGASLPPLPLSQMDDNPIVIPPPPATSQRTVSSTTDSVQSCLFKSHSSCPTRSSVSSEQNHPLSSVHHLPKDATDGIETA